MDYEGTPETEREPIQNKEVETILKNELISRPDMKGFSDVYDEQDIAEDAERVEYLKDKFEEDLDKLPVDRRSQELESQARAEALEVLLGEQIEMNDWFGPDAMVNRTTEYDDIVNGVDAVAEFDDTEGESNHVALVLDATSSFNRGVIEDKVQKNLKKVTGEGRGAEVKYFESQISDYKGRLKNLVPVVIGMDNRSSDKLFELSAQVTRLQKSPYKNESTNEKLKGLRKELEMHPAQLVFLQQIHEQLNIYRDSLAESPDSSYTVEQIDGLLELFTGLIESKEGIELGEEYENERVLNTIRGMRKNVNDKDLAA